MAVKDGGPAFARPSSMDGDTEAWSQDGLSLRDYFAGQALASSDMPTWMGDEDRAASYAKWARLCYEMADAMIAAREKSDA